MPKTPQKRQKTIPIPSFWRLLTASYDGQTYDTPFHETVKKMLSDIEANQAQEPSSAGGDIESEGRELMAEWVENCQKAYKALEHTLKTGNKAKCAEAGFALAAGFAGYYWSASHPDMKRAYEHHHGRLQSRSSVQHRTTLRDQEVIKRAEQIQEVNPRLSKSAIAKRIAEENVGKPGYRERTVFEVIKRARK